MTPSGPCSGSCFPWRTCSRPTFPRPSCSPRSGFTTVRTCSRRRGCCWPWGRRRCSSRAGIRTPFAATDWYVPADGEPVPFMQQRVNTDCTHGTGCTLSAAIATGLGQGMEVGSAIKRAQEYLNLCLRAGYRLGESGGPPKPSGPLDQGDGQARCASGAGPVRPLARNPARPAPAFAARADQRGRGLALCGPSGRGGRIFRRACRDLPS